MALVVEPCRGGLQGGRSDVQVEDGQERLETNATGSRHRQQLK